MSEIGEKIERASVEKFGSLRRACEASGVTYKTLHAQLRNGRKIPFETVEKIASALSISIDYFTTSRPGKIGIAPQRQVNAEVAKLHGRKLRQAHSEMIRHGLPPDCSDILNWLRATGGHINFDDPVCNYVDLFHKVEVTDGLMRPLKVGPASLASLWIGIKSVAEYDRKVSQFNRTIIEASLFAHMRVQEVSRYSVEDVTVYGDIDGRDISESYRRIIAPIHDGDGREFNLVFAELLPTIEWNAEKKGDLPQ